MTTLIRYALLATLLTTLPMAGHSKGNAEPDKNSSVKKQAEDGLKDVSSDIEYIKNMLEVLNKERTSAQRLVQRNDESIGKLNKDVISLEKRLKEGHSDIKKLQRRQQMLTASSEDQKQSVAANLRSMYLSNSDSKIKLLLNQEDPDVVSRQLTYLEMLQSSQLRVVREFEQTVGELNAVEQEKQVLLIRLSQEKKLLYQHKKSLVMQQEKRKKLLSQLSKRYQLGGKELTRLMHQQERLEHALAMIKSQSLDGSRSFKDAEGKMSWPVNGKVLFKFNEKHPETGMRWQGLFIKAKARSQVKAVHDGRIIFSSWLRGYGLLAIVDHGGDYLTLYANNQLLLKSEGESVLSGEALALSGQTGGQLDEGLYFEVRHKGKPKNPLIWLSR